MEITMILMPFFFIAASIYSSVGFGGGSMYLAILALSGFSHHLAPQVALLCNVVVVLGGLWHFARAGHFSWRDSLPFVLTSVPFAILGGSIVIGKQVFTLLLGLSLVVAGTRMLFSDVSPERNRQRYNVSPWLFGLPVGAALGFLSGMVGIGGGIFLAPILFLTRWGNAQKIAATASFFILVNSLGGLFGQVSKAGFFSQPSSLLPLVLAVFLGGQIGSRLGAWRIPARMLQRMTATLLLVAAAQIFWKRF